MDTQEQDDTVRLVSFIRSRSIGFADASTGTRIDDLKACARQALDGNRIWAAHELVGILGQYLEGSMFPHRVQMGMASVAYRLERGKL